LPSPAHAPALHRWRLSIIRTLANAAVQVKKAILVGTLTFQKAILSDVYSIPFWNCYCIGIWKGHYGRRRNGEI